MWVDANWITLLNRLQTHFVQLELFDSISNELSSGPFFRCNQLFRQNTCVSFATKRIVTMPLRNRNVCSPYIKTHMVHYRLAEEVRVNVEAHLTWYQYDVKTNACVRRGVMPYTALVVNAHLVVIWHVRLPIGWMSLIQTDTWILFAFSKQFSCLCHYHS